MKLKALHAINILYVFGTSLMGVLGIFALQGGQAGAEYTLVIAGLAMVLYLTITFGTMKKKRWAYPLGLAAYGIQIPLLATPWFSYSLYLGVKFFVSFSVNSDQASGGGLEFGLNLAALIAVILVLINRSCFQPEAKGRFEKDSGKFPEQLGAQ